MLAMRIGIIEAARLSLLETIEVEYEMLSMPVRATAAEAGKEAVQSLASSGHEVVPCVTNANMGRCRFCGHIKSIRKLRRWCNHPCANAQVKNVLELARAPEAQTEPQLFRGTRHQFLAELRKRREQRLRIEGRSRAVRKAAERAICANKSWLATFGKGEDESEAEAGPLPSWGSSLHSSHSLSFGGGVVFCTRCGAVNSRARNGRLRQQCGSSVKEGSRGRLKRLMAGRCPTGWESWPDGRHRAVRIAMRVRARSQAPDVQEAQTPVTVSVPDRGWEAPRDSANAAYSWATEQMLEASSRTEAQPCARRRLFGKQPAPPCQTTSQPEGLDLSSSAILEDLQELHKSGATVRWPSREAASWRQAGEGTNETLAFAETPAFFDPDLDDRLDLPCSQKVPLTDRIACIRERIRLKQAKAQQGLCDQEAQRRQALQQSEALCDLEMLHAEGLAVSWPREGTAGQ